MARNPIEMDEPEVEVGVQPTTEAVIDPEESSKVPFIVVHSGPDGTYLASRWRGFSRSNAHEAIAATHPDHKVWTVLEDNGATSVHYDGQDVKVEDLNT